MKTIVTKIVLFLFLTAASFAGNIDSLKSELKNSVNSVKVNLLNEISVSYLDVDQDSAKKYANDALKLAEINDYSYGVNEAYFNLGQCYFRDNDFEKSKLFLLKSSEEYLAKKDSSRLTETFIYLAEIYQIQNDDSLSQKYFNYSLEFADTGLDSAQIFTRYGLFNWRKGSFKSALRNFEEALKIRSKSNDQELIASSLNNIGSVYWKRGNYKEALKRFTEALKIRERINEIAGLTTLYGNIGSIYQKLKYYEKAEEYFNRSKNIADSINYKFGKAYSRYNLGILFLELENFEKALDYFQASLVISSSIPERNLMVMTKNYIGLVFEKTKHPKEALKNFEDALDYARENKDQFSEAEILKNMAAILIKLSEEQLALNYINRSLNIAEKENLKELIKDNYYLKYEIFESRGERLPALESYKVFSEMRDSIFNDQIVNSTANLLIRYEIEKTESENKLLKREKELSEAELENEKNLRAMLLVISVLAIGIVIILILLYRFKSKTSEKIKNQKIELEKLNLRLNEQNAILKEMNESKDKLFSIVAHDIRNPFSAIQGYSEVLYNDHKELSREEIKTFAGYLNEASNSLLGLIQNLLDWARSQMKSIKVNYTDFNLNELIDRVIHAHESFAEIKDISIEKEILDNFSVYADYNMIDTVLRNLISNAIKFTPENGKVKISVIKKFDQCEISVKDTGVGMSELIINKILNTNKPLSTKGTNNEGGTGLGLLLCKEFINKNNGVFTIESKIGEGSTFKFVLPTNAKSIEKEKHEISLQ